MLLSVILLMLPHLSIALVKPKIPDTASQYVLELASALVQDGLLNSPDPLVYTSSLPLHPSIETDFADPAIIQGHDGWYSFATSRNGVRVQMAYSKDFHSWAPRNEDAMPKLPAWVNARDPAVWAPDVIRNVRI